MVRASRVLNRQLMVALATLRSVTKAWTSRWRAASPGSRCLRQERDSTLNSISAIPSASSGQGPANCRAWGCSGTPAAWQSAGPLALERSRTATPCGGCSDCPAPLAPLAPPGSPGRLRPPASASGRRSPAWCAAGSLLLAANPPRAHRPGTGCGSPPAGTPSPAAAAVRAGPAERAGSPPTIGWRSRRSRPPAFGGQRVRRTGPAHPPCWPRTRRSPWECTTPSSATA